MSVEPTALIPRPPGKKYKPYQRKGILFARRRRDVLIGDPVGLGKTIQSIGLINLLRRKKTKRVLVVCPAHLRLNWRDELKDWLVDKRRIRVCIEGLPLARSGVSIVSYNDVHKYRDSIDALSWDVLVVDECHYLKTPSAVRTIAVLGRAGTPRAPKRSAISAKRRVYLSGTPALNRPIELWPLLRVIDPQSLGKSFTRYAIRYCDAKLTTYGMDYNGARNLAELRRELKRFMIRRSHKSVWRQMPREQRQTIVLPQPSSQRQQKLLERERLVYESLEAFSSKRGFKIKGRNRAEILSDLTRMRERVALLKVEYVADHLRDAMESGPVVCWAHHHSVIDALRAEFPQASVVDGRVKMSERHEAVRRMQSGETRLFIGGMQAIGTGVRFKKVNQMVFAELDWVPGVIEQCVGRCLWPERTLSLLVQFLVLEGSLDVRFADKLVQKSKILTRMLD